MIRPARCARIVRFMLRYRNAGIIRESHLASSSIDAGAACSPERFVDDLEALGPAFIKLGQALSNRPDLVRQPYLSALARIQDEVGPVDVQSIREVIAAELGGPPERLFRAFDPAPLAAGSLAQVHAVVLHTGEAAVVKVQRPGIGERICADLEALQWLARVSQRHTDAGRKYGAAQWVGELRASLLKELDFLAEAAHLCVFAEHMARYEMLCIPSPHLDLCSARVLTMSRLRGRKLDGTFDRSEQRARYQQAGQLLCAYLDQVFVHGLVHADPHPGNLLALDDGRLALLDFGMVASLSPGMRQDMLQLIVAASEGNGDDVARLCESKCTPLPEADHGAFRRAVTAAVLDYASDRRPHPMGEGSFLLALTRIGADHGLRPSAELSLLGRALLNLESAVLLLAPEFPIRDLLRARMPGMLVHGLNHAFSFSKSGIQLAQVQRLLAQTPTHLANLLATLSENRFKVRIDGLEESHLIENLQKIANRITAGVIIAALLIGGALISRARVGVSGYGFLPLAMFGVAALIGASLLINSLRRDKAPHERDDAD